ncbi:polymorphic toxin-type HINT domain-containing protein [Streptomyces sp. DH17]|nr:polymorphic toxin-type HINT domain-containing protein [Streptomyces sp. DH17]
MSLIPGASPYHPPAAEGTTGPRPPRRRGGHPFWVPELGKWLDATDLSPGQWLRTSAGTHVQITAVQRWTSPGATVHNLTAGNAHTYFVVAGDTSVLVHNRGISAEAREHVLNGVITDDNRFAGWHLHPDQTGGIPDNRYINGDLTTNADGSATVSGTVGARLPDGGTLAKVANANGTYTPSTFFPVGR